MTQALLYAVLTVVPLLVLGWLGPRTGRSTTAPLVTWRGWHGTVLWIGAGAVALLAEAGGQALGLWEWQQTGLMAVHAWWWWASLVLVGLFRLRPLGTGRWFVVQLAGTLAFELPQQAVLGWVDHTPVLGSPYVAIVAIHAVVAGLVVTLAPRVAVRAGLLRRSWGN